MAASDYQILISFGLFLGDHTSWDYHRPERNSVLTPDGSSFLIWKFPPTRARFPLQESQGNLMFFGKSQEKVNEEDYYSCKFLT